MGYLREWKDTTECTTADLVADHLDERDIVVDGGEAIPRGDMVAAGLLVIEIVVMDQEGMTIDVVVSVGLENHLNNLLISSKTVYLRDSFLLWRFLLEKTSLMSPFQ